MSDESVQPATPAPTQTKTPPAEPESSIRETFESIIIAFVLAFVFRAFIVEAFVIPTGSMAPTLLGQNIQVVCPQCGYRFTTGPRELMPERSDRAAEPLQGVWRRQAQFKDGPRMIGSDKPLEVTCPMCEYEADFRTLPISAGDRILVLKYLYAFPSLHAPQRWDVVVFKNPENPEINYIKRLVGLPSEQLWIVDGNVYTRALGPGGQPNEKGAWEIQRKPDRVQRAVWQPIYHSDYFPMDGGERSTVRTRVWTSPWKPGEANDWNFQSGMRLWEHRGQGPGVLRFDFAGHPHFATHVYAYNQFAIHGLFSGDPVEDLRIAATVQPRSAGAGIGMLLGSDGLIVRAAIAADGKVLVETARRGDKGEASGPWSKCPIDGQVAPLEIGKPVRVELWHVDQSVSLWVDGKKVGQSWNYELADIGVDFEALAKGSTNNAMPMAQVTVTGEATVHDADLDRDLYYTNPGGSQRATGDSPATIAADRFFCCGDNSPESADGRLWSHVDPALEALTGVPAGFVPRQMMIGRAFFVYFPAPQHVQPLPVPIIPNFGKMRFIH